MKGLRSMAAASSRGLAVTSPVTISSLPVSPSVISVISPLAAPAYTRRGRSVRSLFHPQFPASRGRLLLRLIDSQPEFSQQFRIGNEAQGFGRDGCCVVFFEREDRHVGRKSRFEFQVGIRSVDDHFVGDHVRFGRGFEPYLEDRPLERVVRIGIYGELYPLAVGDLADVGFVHIGHDLHLCQVVGDGEERRGFESGSHRLALFDGTADDHAVDRRGDGRITQVALYLDHCRLALLVGVAGRFVEVKSLVVLCIAHQLFFMQGLGAGVVLGLVFVFGFAAGELCLSRFEFGL